MLTRSQYRKAQDYTAACFAKAGIAITPEERERIEVVDEGLGILEKVGLQILTYVNTERCCAKEMVLMPYQTCPEHIHNDGVENGRPYVGKEETFRVRQGLCYLYVPGPGRKEDIHARLPDPVAETPVTCFHEIILRPGDQYTLTPGTWHWFQAGPEGAIISEFSTKSRDEADAFTDARIQRMTVVRED